MNSDRLFIILVAIVLGGLVFLHSWRLANVPRGLYVDETSIGLNAALIANTGVDEHGQSWPVFFKAFGEYKNPIYIYGVAFLFRLFGPSAWLLRGTSVMFFGLFLVGFTLLVHAMFRQRTITLFLLMSAGTLPWFFPLSRISFEVVSQLTVTIFALLFFYRAFHQPVNSPHFVLSNAGMSGVLWGLSIYSYSTGRLLAVASVMLILAIYFSRRYGMRLGVLCIGFSVALVPYVWFSYNNPGALTARFKVVSYLYDASLSATEKIQMFVTNYSRHFSPEFLLYTGDTNLRHASGYGGVLFGAVFILACIGLVSFITLKLRNLDRFQVLLLGLLLLSPVAAALTTGSSGQVLRGAVMGIIFLLIAGYGLSIVLQSPHRKAMLAGLLLALFWQASFYMYNYFIVYPQTNIPWFETAGLESALQMATHKHPTTLFITPDAHEISTNVAFYQQIIPGLSSIPILFQNSVEEPGACSIPMPAYGQLFVLHCN